MNFDKHLKAVNNFSNYKIDENGRVFNTQGKEIKQTINRNGYSMVVLSNNGRAKNCSVHRLVAEAYIPNPENKPEVNHKDSNRKNNSVSNLEWCTHSENMKHGYKYGFKQSYLSHDDQKRGARINGEKTKRTVRVIETGIIYSSLHECAIETNCDPGAISKCCNGLAKQHHGYHFEWA